MLYCGRNQGGSGPRGFGAGLACEGLGRAREGTGCCGSSSTAARVGAQLLWKLFQWFPDSITEKNYRYFSFTTGHVQLSNLMLIGAAFYTLVLIADAAFSGGARPPNGPNIAIRLSIASMGVRLCGQLYSN